MTAKGKKFTIAILALSLLTPLALLSAPEHSKEVKEYIKKQRAEAREERRYQELDRESDVHKRLRPHYTVQEMEDYMDLMLEIFPDTVTGGTIGRSVDGRPLRLLRINVGGGDKVQVLVTGNIHAQEIISGRVAMALLEHLATFRGRDHNVDYVLENADIHFIPLLNPDIMAEMAAMQSKWGYAKFRRKNRNGVDLNRNFPYPKDGPDKLADGSGSPKEEAVTYRGPFPLSEPEALALHRYADAHDFLLAINYHSAAGLIIYPPATFPEPTPDTPLMEKMGNEYRDRQFDKYVVKPSIALYPTLGSLDDYLYHRHGTLSFTVEIGKNTWALGEKIYNNTYSPIFWGYNVHDLDRAIGNNVHGAIALIDQAIQVHKKPELRKWKPPEELWVGEPERIKFKEADVTERFVAQ
jgi:predicted deacylase